MLLLIIFVGIGLFIQGCDNAGDGVPTIEMTVEGQIGDTIVDYSEKTIVMRVEKETEITNIEPEIIIPDGHSISPEGPQNFNNPVIYTVTNNAESKSWDFKVEIIVNDDYGLLMSYEGSIQEVHQGYINVNPGDIYRFSALFKAWDFDWGWVRWAGVRINFKEGDRFFEATDIDLDDMNISVSDLSIVWNSAGNIYVESRDRGADFTGYTEEIGWYEIHYEFKVPPNADTMRVALHNNALNTSNVIWANPSLINTASPDINLYQNFDFKNVDNEGVPIDWNGVEASGVSVVEVFLP